MFDFIKKIFTASNGKGPVIETVGFSDGLLSFRSRRSLGFQSLTVSSLTSHGSVSAEVDIQSYDAGQQIYRAVLKNRTQALRNLELQARGTERLPKAVRVSSADLPNYFALTEDLSVDGVRLSTTHPLQVGRSFEMSIDLDDANTPLLNVTGEVRWTASKADGSHHSGMGFVGLGPSEHRTLTHYIQSRIAAQKAVHR